MPSVGVIFLTRFVSFEGWSDRFQTSRKRERERERKREREIRHVLIEIRLCRDVTGVGFFSWRFFFSVCVSLGLVSVPHGISAVLPREVC